MERCMAKLPKWLTPERQEVLARLSLKANLCLKGHPQCENDNHYIEITRKAIITVGWEMVRIPSDTVEKPFGNAMVAVKACAFELRPHQRLMNVLEEDIIREWHRDDTAERLQLKQLQETPLPTGEVGRFGEFINVNTRRRESDPVSHLEHCAKRPSYYVVGQGVDPMTNRRTAMVRVPSTNIELLVKAPSKNQRRKARRYGTGKPETLDKACDAAVQAFWTKT